MCVRASRLDNDRLVSISIFIFSFSSPVDRSLVEVLYVDFGHYIGKLKENNK